MTEHAPADSQRIPKHLLEKMQYYQNSKQFTHMKGPHDKITSVVISSVLAGTAIVMMARGFWNMANGIGKKE